MESIDWTYFKRATHVFKQKINIEPTTFDEEFNELEKEFNLSTSGLYKLKENLTIYTQSVQNILISSRNVGTFTIDLYNPLIEGSNSENSIQEEALILQKDVKLYIDCICDAIPMISSEISLVKGTLIESVNAMISNCENIKKKCKKRISILIEIDSIQLKLNKIAERRSSNDLSLKQSQQSFSFERNLKEINESYNTINIQLKTELPIFLQLIDKAIIPIQRLIYFLQLLIYYQVSNNVSEMKEAFNCNSTDSNYILEFNKRLQPYIDSADQLTIVKFRENFYSNLISPSKICQAIFTFEAKAEGDLSIKRGDIIKITNKEGNWYTGELNGKIGRFPDNYVKIL
ncbi:hypothetical protein CAAN1_02S05314 [[Candida] anglica]|uniref:SH3 domain-containing protein n=1 Tax=[Candida] anglica TaxID=148631 RepID=A0ABP0ECG3_9ASCO